MGKNTIYDAEIKVNNWNKIIKVNEQGDTITLNIGDASLNSNLVILLKSIQKISEELSNVSEKFNDDNVVDKLDFINLKMTESAEKIDSFFGEGTCMKVFRTNTPYIDDIADFIIQMCDLIKKFTGEKLENFEETKNTFIEKQKKRKRV